MADINPDLVQTEWHPNWTSYVIKFVIISAVFMALLVSLFAFGNIQELTSNFPKYRCNPALMPFASAFGYDAKENFNFCMSSVFNSKAAEIFSPIYKLLSEYTQVITTIVNATLGIRQLFSNFFLSINNFIGNVRNRIQNLLFRIRLSFLRMQHLMERVYGTMYSVIWMGTSALAAGTNLSNNAIVKFLFSFCFNPNTPVRLATGAVVPIHSLQIGDALAPIHGRANESPIVTSIFQFDGTHTPMVTIGEIHVSAEHYVLYQDGWIAAKDHPLAKDAPTCPKLYCLNVSTNEFYVGSTQLNELSVSDYDEHTDAHIVRQVQTIAEKALNNQVQPQQPLDNSYSLGIDPSLFVEMEDDTWKCATEIQIHDRLKHSGAVLGIVYESCENVHSFPDCKHALSASQCVFDTKSNTWKRAMHMFPTMQTLHPSTLIQFITQQCSAIHVRTTIGDYYIRDYREVPLPDMETPYENAFINNCCRENA